MNSATAHRYLMNALLVLLSIVLVTVRVRAAESLIMENQHLRVELHPESGSLDIIDRAQRRMILHNEDATRLAASVKRVEVDLKSLGKGQAIEIGRSNGVRDQLILVDDLPFVLVRSVLINESKTPVVLNHVEFSPFTLRVSENFSGLRAFGTAGLTKTDENPGSYAYLAIVDPKSRSGIVSGWITQDRGSGVIFSSVQDSAVSLNGRLDYGCLRLDPGESCSSELFAIGYFEDARLGLEQYADAIRKVYSIHLAKQLSGYCTWYSDQHGKSSDEQHLKELAEFAKKNLAPFGLDYVQIDDEWQTGAQRNGPAKNFSAANPSGPYPSGMKATADQLKSLGFIPGLWFMPFAGDHLDPIYQPHPDYFVQTTAGKPYETEWGGTSLDMTFDPAREHLKQIAQRMTRDWGFKLLKVDGLFTGTATKQIYINDGYKDDGIGDAVFHNPRKTNIEAYRDGLKLLRESAGADTFILGCCAPQNMRSFGGTFGLVDAMRIGNDNSAQWPGLMSGPIQGSRKYFLHGRVWYNDPDPAYVRDSIPLNHAQLICSWIAITGQWFANSDWLPDLSPARLDILKRTMLSHGLLARPVDLFENDPPRIWLLTDDRKSPRRDVVALFNWDSRSRTIECPMDRIGLPCAKRYVGFDYWKNESIEPVQGALSLAVEAESCRVIALRRVSDAPQLISTSRHVTQGIVDVIDEKWDSQSHVLSGRSRVVADDSYELRVSVAKEDGHPGWLIESAGAKEGDGALSVGIQKENGEKLLRVRMQPRMSGEVEWQIRFRENAK